jgi:hypothetical protein
MTNNLTIHAQQILKLNPRDVDVFRSQRTYQPLMTPSADTIHPSRYVIVKQL